MSDSDDIVQKPPSVLQDVIGSWAPHPYQSLNADGEIMTVNDAWLDLLGYDREDVIGRWFGEILTNESRTKFESRFEDFKSSGRVSNVEFEVTCADGSTSIVSYDGVIEYDDQGNFVQTHCQFTDITDRKEERGRLAYLESLENQLTEFSRDLIAANPESLEEKIADGLTSLGKLANADRSYVFQITRGDKTLGNTHEWTAEGIEPQIDDVQDLPLDALPWLVEQLENDESVTIPDVSELPPEASAIREILEGQDIRSLIVSPMFSEGDLIGFIGVDWVEKQEAWSEEFVDLLRISGEMIAAKLQQESQRNELERVKERLELAVEGANLGVWDWDMETDAVSRHVNLREMLGYSPAEFGNDLSNWEQLVHPEGKSKHDEALREHIENRTDFYECEYRLRAKSGDWKWIRNIGKVVEWSEDGSPKRAVGIHIDIDERKEYERELENREAKYRSLFEDARDAIILTDNEGFFDCNEMTLELFGFDSVEALTDQTPWDHSPETQPDGTNSEEAAQNYIETAFEEGEVFFEWVHTRSDGTEFPAEVKLSRFEIDGEPVLRTLIRDITERKEYERELQEQRDNLEILNQVLRHDVRNDLQLVTAYTDLLMETCDNDEATEYISTIAESTEHAVELTETARKTADVMLSTSADTHQIGLEPVLDDAVSEVQSAYPEAAIIYETPIPAVRITADEMASSVFRNLLKNAVQHNDKDVPEVGVSATDQDGTVTVRITDNGLGVPDEQKESIFGKGERGLGSSGTGIGLYLVETLVTSYDGEVWVEDNEPEGSVFVVELPIAE